MKATKLSGSYNPVVDLAIAIISKIKCPICELEIGAGKNIIVTPDKIIYHFDCYISQSEEHEK